MYLKDTESGNDWLDLGHSAAHKAHGQAVMRKTK